MTTRMKGLSNTLAVSALSLSLTAFATSPCTHEVQFKKGASSATYAGHIAGYEYCDYVFTASTGQTLTVAVAGRHSNRITPVLFGPDQQADLSGPLKLERGGRHTVRIVMPRVFARRGIAVDYKVTITLR
jgi:hypothetical protein